VTRAFVVTCCAVLCLTACGATKQAAVVTSPKQCVSPRAIAKLDGDIAAIRKAADLPTKSTLLGNAAINRATDRFLSDVDLAHITNLARNRMIDHAAGALAGACEQCFQALEAERPIPNISKGVEGC
jgi:hypothetical protein